ncbi:MAG: pre-peptidase C-terminal domain-containing protein [Candidatus Cloacimonetes bacterium]|nr:pre-peptidase C-terminal domain-containing protein [Candidatus Cloacimonadota bacterium]
MKQYLLIIFIISFAGLTFSIAETEPNDTWDATGVQLVTGMNCGDITPAYDLDYWKFQSTVGDQIEIHTCDAGTDFDTQLWIYDTDGTTMIAYNDDDCGLQSRVTMTTSSDGTYYFCVGGWGMSTGHYEVWGPPGWIPPPPGQANTPNPANGCNDVPVNGTLTWSFGWNTATYNLLIGTQGNMLEVVSGATAGADGTQGSYTYTNLMNSTTYEWQLILDNGFGFIIDGCVWSFTTSVISCQIKIYLKGAYNQANHNMVLDINGAIPLISPYSDALTILSMPANIVDWVYVQLRSTPTGASIFEQSYLLQDDGFVVDETGNPIGSNILAGDYYVVVTHRNHLGIMSADAQPFTASGTTLSNLTLDSSTYDSGIANEGVKLLETGIYGMIAGETTNPGYT